MRDLDDKISALERTLEQDFGEEEEYAPMRGQCFEVSDLVGFPYKFEIFTLKMCVFLKKILGVHLQAVPVRLRRAEAQARGSGH